MLGGMEEHGEDAAHLRRQRLSTSCVVSACKRRVASVAMGLYQAVMSSSPTESSTPTWLPHHREKWRVIEALVRPEWGWKLIAVQLHRRDRRPAVEAPDDLPHSAGSLRSTASSTAWNAANSPRDWCATSSRWPLLRLAARPRLRSTAARAPAPSSPCRRTTNCRRKHRPNPAENVPHSSRCAFATSPAKVLLQPPAADNRGTGRILDDGGQRVPVITLDAFVAEHGITRLDAMKIDVEGAEVRGAAAVATPTRFRPAT